MKRKAVQSKFSDFVSQLKATKPKKWYEMAKRIGAVQKSVSEEEFKIPELIGLSPQSAAEKIADFYASVSNEYDPIDRKLLPHFLPSSPPSIFLEHEVYSRLMRLKNTKSTYPLDIPFQLRKECAIFLAAPLTNIFNSCLQQQSYPDAWKV